MQAHIVTDLVEFFQANDVSCRCLARESGVASPIITRVLSGERKDMTSRNADALRKAMKRLAKVKSHASEA